MTILQERKSTYGLVDQVSETENNSGPRVILIRIVVQIFRSHNSRPEFGRSADAIPDGHPRRDTSLRTREVLIPIPELIGMDLPSRQVVNFMLDNFLESVHWFMMLFYQPTIRTEIDEIVTSGLIPKRRLSFLILVLLILAMGAKYAAQSDTVEHCSSSELANLRSKFMAKVEEKFLDVFDEGDIESVQISVLLASYYLYHRRPKRAFAVIGAGVKSAQALGLNRELSWGPVSSITREVRRRVWWALFVADGYETLCAVPRSWLNVNRFTALCYGKPSTIQENDWQVDMVDDIDDASARCPGFNSTELREDGTYQPVTLLSYQRYKFDLYRIAAPITRTIYYHRGATMREVVARVKEINRWLVELEERIPPELKMASFSSHVSGATSNPAVRTFQLQALALQLSYDNIQLILHRPLLTYTGGLSTSPLSGPSTGGPSQGRSANDRSAGIPAGDDLSQGSRSQCWEAAIRTSQIGEYSWILETARDTHAAAYIGIQTFTAGAILAMFALTDPLASQAQEAKHAIARLIRMPQSAGLSTHVSDQSGGILEGLLRLILDEEMKSLISRGGIGSGRGSPPVALEGRGIRRADPSGPSTEAAGSAFRHSSHIPGLQGTDGREDGLVSSNAAPGPGTLPLAATGNVTETMTLMQHGKHWNPGALASCRTNTLCPQSFVTAAVPLKTSGCYNKAAPQVGSTGRITATKST